MTTHFPAIAARFKACGQAISNKYGIAPQYGCFWNFCINGAWQSQWHDNPDVYCLPHLDAKNPAIGCCVVLAFGEVCLCLVCHFMLILSEVILIINTKHGWSSTRLALLWRFLLAYSFLIRQQSSSISTGILSQPMMANPPRHKPHNVLMVPAVVARASGSLRQQCL